MARDVDALLELHIPALRRYAYAVLRDVDAADDLVQDCLERALSRSAWRRPDGDLRAWLFAILRNLHRDRLRTLARRGGVHVSIEHGELTQGPTQDASVYAGDVLAALDLLPEEQRTLLLLISVEDFSYQEAANVLQLPIGTVMSRLSRARGRLRELMEGIRPPTLRRVK